MSIINEEIIKRRAILRKKIEYQKSSIRAEVEHVFLLVKKLFKYRTRAIPKDRKIDAKNEYNVLYLQSYIWLTKKLSWINLDLLL